MAQIEILGPQITGELNARIVEVPANAPTNVIPSTSAWRIECEWFLAPPGAVVGGSWRLQAFLEGQGTGPESETAPIVVPIDGRVTPPGPSYRRNIEFPAPQALPGGVDQVIYRVSVALTYRTLQNRPGPFAALLDLGMLQIFRNEP